MATIKSAGVDSTIPYHVRFNYIHHPPFHSNLPHPVYSTETALKTLTTTIIHPVSSPPNNNLPPPHKIRIHYWLCGRLCDQDDYSVLSKIVGLRDCVRDLR